MGQSAQRVLSPLIVTLASVILFLSIPSYAYAQFSFLTDAFSFRGLQPIKTKDAVLSSTPTFLRADVAMHATIKDFKKDEPKKEEPIVVQSQAVLAHVVQAPPVIISPAPQVAEPAPETGSLNADTLFAMVNTYRTDIGLPALEKHADACSIAASRAPEIYNEIYVTYSMHAGLYNRNLPYFITENIIHMNTEEQAFSWWLNSPVHRNQIQGNYQYSCTACVGKACSQVFTSFTPKEIVL